MRARAALAALVILFVITGSGDSGEANSSMVCGPQKVLREAILALGERRVWSGISTDGFAVHLYQSDSGSWTVILSKDGVGCISSHGGTPASPVPPLVRGNPYA